MKKNVIALGVSAALLSLAGAASASVIENTALGALTVNAGGIGHQLVFPYFTTQGNNNTLINIVNTDTTNGKAVKVRFRGAGNSDDLFDFQVLMSPGDVWTASLTQNGAGVTQLATTDNTCVIPSKAAINVAFTNTVRVDQAKDIANQTREGYIEIINMADIPPAVYASTAGTTTTTNPLFSVIKHNASGVATCDSTATGVAVLAKLKKDPVAVEGPVAGKDDGSLAQADSLQNLGMTFPTTGLTGDWVILNTETQAAWSGSAVALQVSGGVNGANAVFFPQLASDKAVTAQNTTDPLLVAGVVTSLSYDFPDLSTAYSAADAAAQRLETTNALLVGSVSNEWNSDANIGGSTDLLFTQPMRRYWAAVNYKASAATLPGAIATTGTVAAALYNPTGGSAVSAVLGFADAGAGTTDSPYAGTSTGNTVMSDRLLCLKDVSLTQYDREERTTTTDFVVSPGTRGQLDICGEAAVTSINGGGNTSASALEAAVARNDVTLSFDKDGWVAMELDRSLPLIGAAFMKVSNAVQSYGFAFPHKTTAGTAYTTP